MDALKMVLSTDVRIGTTAEFIATFLFVYIGCGSVVASGTLNDGLDSARLLVIATAHGLAIAVLASATGGLSGGHINPAVTLGMMLVKKIPSLKGLMYIAAQISGAVLGAGLLHELVPSSLRGDLGAHGKGDWEHSSPGNWIHGVGGPFGGSPLYWRFHEPSSFSRSGCLGWEVEQHLGLLRRPVRWSGICFWSVLLLVFDD